MYQFKSWKEFWGLMALASILAVKYFFFVRTKYSSSIGSISTHSKCSSSIEIIIMNISSKKLLPSMYPFWGLMALASILAV